jgi:hypothetical protein
MGTTTVICPFTGGGTALVTGVHIAGGFKLTVLSRIMFPVVAGQEIAKPPLTRETVMART